MQSITSPRRPLSDAQRAVFPLAPIFAACKARGLAICDANRVRRLAACNAYCARLEAGFDWMETSFKDLSDPAQITVLADAIEGGWLTW